MRGFFLFHPAEWDGMNTSGRFAMSRNTPTAPHLFHLMEVEGIHLASADTEKGQAARESHQRRTKISNDPFTIPRRWQLRKCTPADTATRKPWLTYRVTGLAL